MRVSVALLRYPSVISTSRILSAQHLHNSSARYGPLWIPEAWNRSWPSSVLLPALRTILSFVDDGFTNMCNWASKVLAEGLPLGVPRSFLARRCIDELRSRPGEYQP